MRLSSLLTGIIMTLASSFAAKAQGGLVEMPVPNLRDSYQEQVTLAYNAGLGRPHKLTPDEQKAVDDPDSPVIITYPLETKLNRSGKYFVVACDSGGSDDFGCSFTAIGGALDKNNHLPGLRFEIPGDNCVYASGHNDTMFNLRRKFCLDGDRLKEVKQPLHYVGLRSKTVRDLTFYSDLTLKTPVGTIPRGEFVEVLVANIDQDSNAPSGLPTHNHFLVRDKRGLTGWVGLDETQEAQGVEGLFFAGD